MRLSILLLFVCVFTQAQGVVPARKIIGGPGAFAQFPGHHGILYSPQILAPIVGGASAAVSYIGPGDVQPYVTFYSLEAYSAATRGNKVATVCDASDVNCVDMLTDATTGLPIVPTSNPNCTSGCTIKTLFSLPGGTPCGSSVVCDVTQATIANRPILTSNCITGKWCMVFSPGQLLDSGTTHPWTAVPITVTGVAKRTGAFTSYGTIASLQSIGIMQLVFNASTNTILLYAGGTALTATAADSTFHAFQGLFNGASSKLYVDGTLTNGDSGTANPASTTICIGSCGNNLTGQIFEVGFTGSDVSSTFAAVNANQRSRYGF